MTDEQRQIRAYEMVLNSIENDIKNIVWHIDANSTTTKEDIKKSLNSILNLMSDR